MTRFDEKSQLPESVEPMVAVQELHSGVTDEQSEQEAIMEASNGG